jgi:hypothetical protein
MESLTTLESSDVYWLLTVVETMRAEWGCSLREAMWTESLVAALALYPALLARHGCDPGMSHVDRARQAAKERARRWIAERYEVVG